MALVRLLPEQAAYRWPIIKLALEKTLLSLPEYDEDSLLRILKGLQMDTIQCWFNLNSEKKANCVLLTTIVYEPLSDTKTLLIFLIYAYDSTQLNEWIKGFHTLARFAVKQDCKTISGFTSEETIISYAIRFGGDVRSYVSIDLTNYVKNLNGVRDDQSLVEDADTTS